MAKKTPHKEINTKYVHTAMSCDINECVQEATHWVANVERFDTFYLCEVHKDEISNEVGEYVFIEGGEIHSREIAEYSCNERCEICNSF